MCRSRLHERLDLGLETALTVVSAPAGYGKSALVRHWAEGLEHPCAWVSLDQSDSDLRHFLAYVLAAVQEIFPGSCEQTATLLRGPRLPPVPALAHHLVNEVDALDTPFVLALDDYHRIAQPSGVHELLTLLLRHPPEPLRLVVISRRDPPLPLSVLRAGSRLTEVRLQDLRFTGPETAALLERAAGFTASDDVLAELDRDVEGWGVGLRLAALALRHAESPEAVLKGMAGGVQQVREYLVAEVLAAQPPEMQEWLFQTSILDRFCPELCDAVCAAAAPPGTSGLTGGRFIEALQGEGLFVISLDTRGEWFRYHHLFQELLQDQLKRRKGPDEVARLHSRASAWLAERHLVGEAIDQALAAGDASTAAEIVERTRVSALDNDRWGAVEDWLARLPEEVVAQRTGLLLARAWVKEARHQLAEIPGILAQLNLCPDGLGEEEAGEVALFEGILHFYSGEADRCLEQCEKALALIPESSVRFRGEAELYRALCLQMSGQADRAIRLLEDPVAEQLAGEPVRLTRLIGGQVFVHLLSAELPEASVAVTRFSRLREKGPFVSSWGEYLRAIVCWWGNDIAGAVCHFDLVAEHRYLFNPQAAVDGLIGRALLCVGREGAEEATEAMNGALEFAAESRDPVILQGARSGQARLALLQGDQESAERWRRSAVHPPPDVAMMFWLEVPSVTRCRVLIANGSPAALREALEHLEEHRAVTRVTHNTCRTIETLVLQTVALEKLGRGEEALAVLGEAAALAGPGGWIRPFVDSGSPLAALLRRLPRDGAHAAAVERVVSAVADAEGRAVAPDPSGPVSQPMVDPLTLREIEVLELLGQRLRDKEIAERLYISPQTVKSHLKSVYQKLEVTGRRQAVAKATELRILGRA